MHEEFLHHLWKNQLFLQEDLRTVQNHALEIITPGTHNTDAGPDFLNARIKLNNIIWAGNIEIHCDSTQWTKHGHHKNKAYDNVVLHVVANHNANASNTRGEIIPTFILPVPKNLEDSFKNLMSASGKIPCSGKQHIAAPIDWKMWLDRMCIERLEEKSEFVYTLLSQNQQNWEVCLYQMIARSFGFNTNSLPFEMLARLTPYQLISKYHENLFQLEALLYGQAGFLHEKPADTYMQKLTAEYQYLQKLHGLKSIDKHLWRFMRLRPGNFPIIRLAQFASFLHHTNHLVSSLTDCDKLQNLQKIFQYPVSEYWKNHYTFGKEGKSSTKSISTESSNILLINAFIPFLFVYGKETARPELCQRSLELLETLPVEKNAVTKHWEKLQIHAANAAQSQALIQLSKKYCTERKCLYCQVGNSILLQSFQTN